LAGAAAKIALATVTTPLAPVFWLYALNATSVGLNLALQWYFGRQVKTSGDYPAGVKLTA
jgi:hypothetical protein